jgi:acetyltransferase-like isoleucine patch superfamily enzyme
MNSQVPLLYKLLVLKRSVHERIHTRLLRAMFQHVGKQTEIDPSFWFEDPHLIYIADRVQIRRGVVMLGRSEEETGIYLGEGCHIKEYAYLDAYGGSIHLGKEVRIGHHCVIAGHGGLTFKDWAGIAGLSYVIAAGRRYENTRVPVLEQEQTRESIIIGERAWAGCGVSILDGVTIGDGTVIGAGSVVTDPVPDYCVAWGVPAKVQRYLRKPTE